MDHYDVEAMIRDALIAERNAWERETNDLRRECDFIRQELRKLERVLASRTEHLV